MTVLRVLCMIAILLLGCMHGNEREPVKEAKVDEIDERFPDDIKLRAIEVADNVMKHDGADLNMYRRDIVGDSISFKIYYILKDTLMLGGGGMFRVSKKDLTVIGGYREQ